MPPRSLMPAMHTIIMFVMMVHGVPTPSQQQESGDIIHMHFGHKIHTLTQSKCCTILMM